jgi:hypothetical protein
MRVAWINRSAQPRGRMGIVPDVEMRSAGRWLNEAARA